MRCTGVRRLALAVPVAALCMMSAAPSEAADTGIAGTVTITGTEGRDDVRVTVARRDPPLNGLEMVVTPPSVTLSATSGSCQRSSDPLTGRPSEYRCPLGSAGLAAVVVDLRGGDDSLTLDGGSGPNQPRADALGGAGNDVLGVDASSARQLSGGDGDDVLRAEGDHGTAIAFDGGPGRDLVDFGSVVFGGDRLGVSASLATGRATYTVPTGLPAGFSVTDTLAGIERLWGTSVGDVLTGSNAADELLGSAGPDVLNGNNGNDVLGGEAGADELIGGKGADTVDGGTEIDDFPLGSGGDTIVSRDGFLEQVTCASGDVLVDDLVDRVVSPQKCLSISTAQAKHRRDTVLSGRALRIGAGRALRPLVRCPRSKPDRCVGTLVARLGGRRGRTLGRARYRVRPGHATRARFKLSARQARRARGATLTLQADEVDGDGRERHVVRRVPVRRRGS